MYIPQCATKKPIVPSINDKSSYKLMGYIQKFSLIVDGFIAFDHNIKYMISGFPDFPMH